MSRSLASVVYEADKILPLPLPLKRGDSFRHHAFRPFVLASDLPVFDPREIGASIVDDTHVTEIRLHTALDRFRTIAECEPVFTPTLIVTYCERCKTLWWAHVES